MSANLARLRKRAAEFEQKKQFEKALEVYVQILDEGGKDLGDEDVPLFNRVGDMLMRKGSVTDALGYYERAVDMYAERGYLNNAIALCSKILRQSPGRAQVYYKLARISARKGFKSDARKNFLEYADRMQKLGMADEAFRALKEFASLYPDQDDIRLVLAELLSKENRKGEAIEQLQSLYEKLQSEGRSAEARATVDRMRAIDPSATPREGTESQPSSPAGDLIFLDLSDAETPRATPSAGPPPAPVSARAPVPTPVPALTGLSITFFPDEEAPHPAGFESTAVEQEPVDTTPMTRSLTPGGELVIEPMQDVVDELPDEIELVVESPPVIESAHPLLEQIDPLDLIAHEPVPLERVEEALDHLLPDVTEPVADAPKAPARYQTPMTSFEFADLELDDAPQEQPQRDHDLALPGRLPQTPSSEAVVDDPASIAEDELPVFAPSMPSPVSVPTVSVPSPASDAAVEDARAAAEEMADLVADVAAREAAHAPQSRTPESSPEEVERPDEAVPEVPEPAFMSPERTADDVSLLPSLESAGQDMPDDFMSMPPSFGSSSEPTDDHAFPPLLGLDETPPPVEVPAVEEPAAKDPTPRATISIGSAEGHLRRRLEIEPENWDLRRQLGEALLDTGDRDGGLYELELAMVGYEMRGDMDRAQEVVDEILSVFPGSVAHHQKRVEFAVRTRDRTRLANSYLELADALFRTGAADKAVAVYSRVLELDHGNERAEFALATLAPDALVRLRGVPARPDRWTDELTTIEGSPRSPDESAPDIGLPDESRVQVEVPPQNSPEELPEAPVAESLRVRFASLELPIPDWDESASQAEPEMTEPELSSDRGQLDVEPPSASNEAPVDEVAIAEELGDGPAERTPTPTPASAEAIRTPTPLSQPAFRVPTPASMPVPRDQTPRASPVQRPPTPVPAARPVTPIEVLSATTMGGDNDFVDLGDWLRATEPVRSTRMQVEDPKPTGDEQADFEEMLRRFKRGVAENVEAEDYEAHYDLGVAYKEMGLVDEAIAQFQKALRGSAHRVRSYEALGQCFVEKGQYPIAAALLQRATEVPGSDDQQLVGVLYLLGYALEHLGRPAEALPYYLRVFAVDIEFRDVAERVTALGKTIT